MSAPPGSYRPHDPRPLLAVFSASALLLAGCPEKGPARPAATRTTSLYDQGKYADALPVLVKTLESGRRDGTLLYQIGYCRLVVEKKDDERKAAWKEAEPLLEKEIAAPGGATLERLYYLTVIKADAGAYGTMTQYARQAVEQFEKGPDPNGLTGDDWFRLGRLHDYLMESSEAEAAYRRSVSAYAREQGVGSVYASLALAKVGDFEFKAGHYPDAADDYDRALKAQPTSDQVSAYRHGLVLLAIGRFDDAVPRFVADRDPQTMEEAQYGADLARKAKEVAPLPDKDLDGLSAAGLLDDALRDRVRQAAKDLRAARVKNSMKPGDPLPAEVADRQRRFVYLLRQLLVRRKEIQQFCLEEGIADLVRR